MQEERRGAMVEEGAIVKAIDSRRDEENVRRIMGVFIHEKPHCKADGLSPLAPRHTENRIETAYTL